jgi:hypothetical protein
MERDPLADSELEHGHVRVKLSQEPQPRHDSVIKIDQLGFRQHVNIDRHRVLSLFERLQHLAPQDGVDAGISGKSAAVILLTRKLHECSFLVNKRCGYAVEAVRSVPQCPFGILAALRV